MTTPSTPPAEPPAGIRAARLRQPLARHVLEAVAAENGVCIRPLAMRRVDVVTGETEIIPVSCGATLASKCPPCAERARKLRMAQCKAGWHLDDEPLPDPDPPTDDAKTLVQLRADLEAVRTDAVNGHDVDQVGEVDDLISQVDTALNDLGVRGKTAPDNRDRPRRTRSTRRRQDAPDLPRLPVDRRTVGRTFTGSDGTVWRPSMFLTLTCDSYGRVNSDGAPVDPVSYDYRRAARDAIHFPKLVDRFWQNMRRAVGWDIQYFACLEPQRRLAPHLHAAMRGTIPRVLLRQVAAATYHQVWWPACDRPVYGVDRLPVWDDEADGYVDPDAHEPLPTWDEALDAIGDDAEPTHVVRFGVQVRADGVTANNSNTGRLIGYLCKYLTKSLDTCHDIATDAQRAHVDRLADALRYEPCSPGCSNWLLYGVQPKNPRAGLVPGRCKGKVHRRETLGFGGRRVLVSRKWSGKTLADHKEDRKTWIREQLAVLGHTGNGDGGQGGQGATPDRVVWQLLHPGDPAMPRREHLLLRAVADRHRWRAQLDAARAARGDPHPVSATDPSMPHAA
ncbi:replication initiator [Frankia sp. Cr2]|uniref:replication initiator n=1 Tax=Frankia sp. Cr2 TaxID=3073932 RepID=UPI002AD55AFC|nr:replication initiator [Frankia sp. Cr2]